MSELKCSAVKRYKLHFMWMWSNMACDFLEEVHCISTFISINFIIVINFYLCCLREVQNICTSQMMLCNMQIMPAICIDKPVLIHLFKQTNKTRKLLPSNDSLQLLISSFESLSFMHYSSNFNISLNNSTTIKIIDKS